MSFTSEEHTIARSLPELLLPTAGATALFDGIYAGVTAAKQEAHNERGAVIIVSDGGDNHSRYSLRKIRQFLKEADVPVFAVMAGRQFQTIAAPQNTTQLQRLPIPIPIPNADFVGPAEQQGPSNLKSLTEVTGGGVFTARDSESLTRIARTISTAVRYQYVLSYEPHGTGDIKRPNNWHEIRLELTPEDKFRGYKIYYKRGYYQK
jgi:Ca-activated chloride channel family protein